MAETVTPYPAIDQYGVYHTLPTIPGGQPMTMREELIDKAARAWWGAVADEHNSWDTLGADEKVELCAGAAASLDAILAGLDEPSEEMVEAGVVAMCGGGGYGERVFDVLRAMLKPLKGE